MTALSRREGAGRCAPVLSRGTRVESSHLTPGSCSVRLDRALGATKARVQGKQGGVGGQEARRRRGSSAVQGPAPVCLFSEASY